ncbi:MAG: P-loop NTPase [Candidatus Aenigmarchaeota archaeon]|nr:P-loop NTPase [Candidatus Aenigmarchaeota archaeon]
MTRIIGIVSGKGGVGKTTVVTNLGVELVTKFKKDVVIIDCNITTSHLSMVMGMHFLPITLNQVLRGNIPIENAVYTHQTGLKIIPASLAVKDVEGIEASELKKAVKHLLGKVDLILLDSAPCLGREAKMTLDVSEELLFVTTPYVPSVMDTIRTKEMVEPSKTKLGTVLNMIENMRHELTVKEIENLTEMPVLAQIPYDRNILKSLAAKQPVVTYNPYCKASKQFLKLGREITGEDPINLEKEDVIGKLTGLIKGVGVPRF